MAMEDMRRLAKPHHVDNLVPYGPWKEADVYDVSLYVRHGEGFYFGSVRMQIDSSKKAQQRSFWELWLEGWTSAEFMNQCKDAQAAERKGGRVKRRK